MRNDPIGVFGGAVVICKSLVGQLQRLCHKWPHTGITLALLLQWNRMAAMANPGLDTPHREWQWHEDDMDDHDEACLPSAFNQLHCCRALKIDQDFEVLLTEN